MSYYTDSFNINPEEFCMPDDQGFGQPLMYWTPNCIDVAVHYTPSNENEYYPGMPAKFTPNGDLNLTALIEHLKSEGFPIGEKSMIYYYSKYKDCFSYCGKDPLPYDIFVPMAELDIEGSQKIVKIKVRNQVLSGGLRNPDQTTKIVEPEPQSQQKDEKTEEPSSNKITRYGERRIGDVLELVRTWRQYHEGVVDPETNEFIKLTLTDSADKLGIKRKTLDDYYIMINKADKLGFEFEKHYNARFGVLRAYVKKFKPTTGKGKEAPSHHSLKPVKETLIAPWAPSPTK